MNCFVTKQPTLRRWWILFQFIQVLFLCCLGLISPLKFIRNWRLASNLILGPFDTEDNLTPRTIWHHHKFYISTIVWPRNMIRNILIATIYLFDWKLSCIMSLYQIRARQGPHIKTYLISWQLFGPKISLEIHCWPIITFFKTVGENFSQCQIVLFCMMVSNCPILHDGVKLS